MQLQPATGYALRIMTELSYVDKISLSALSKKINIQEFYLTKILTRLKKEGLVKSYAGIYGGFSLAKDASDITVWMIIQAIEPCSLVSHCLEGEGCCSRNATSYCAVRKVFQEIQGVIEDTFTNVTLESLKKERR